MQVNKQRETNGRFKKGLVFGVGLFDSILTTKEEGQAYKIWRHVLMRCYCPAYQKRQKTYIGCQVAESWKTYTNFKLWFNENYIEGWELDKDLLGDGKLYSPETCCFLPKCLNLALPKQTSKNRKGVRFNGYSYTAQCADESGNANHLGSYKTKNEALEVYYYFKNKVIANLANKFKDYIKPKVLETLINFDCKNKFKGEN